MTAKQESVRSWLAKAASDLGTARKLADGPDAYLDTAIYHCQQAAEKALKGLLVYHGQPAQKTHDVRFLVSLAGQIEAGFDPWLDAGSRLTAYATEFRYPGPRPEPDADEFQDALGGAEGIYDLVLSLLPGEVHP